MKLLQTITGSVLIDTGIILPHEHIFTDLRGPSTPGYAQADPEDVIRVLAPLLSQAEKAGVTVLVECSTIGVGRNISILQEISKITTIQLIVPTGLYQDALIPESKRISRPGELAEEWLQEVLIGIEGTQVRAGFIKLAVSDTGISNLESRNLQAAADVSRQTCCAVACHTPNGELFQQEFHILENAGLDPGRLIWVHANLEKDKQLHLDAARRGCYIEFDAVGADWQAQGELIDFTLNLLNSGHGERILLSHDAGWYQPGTPGGQPDSGMRGYTELTNSFLPSLKSHGVSGQEIDMLTRQNPFQAFALEKRG